MAKKAFALAATVAVAAIALSGCSSSGSAGNSIDGKPTGTITVLTQRTDLVSDGTFKKYAAEFNKAYPDVTVKFEGVNDYENAIKTRLNGTKYGDVLAIPAAVKPSQLAQFFEPLGKTADFSGKYRYTSQASYNGTQYGIVSGGNANGIVYNKKVWEKAGITKLPTTETEWLDDLKLIKSKTDAIPLYTNYKDGWPLSQGMGNLGAITNNVNAAIDMAENPTPWKEGTDIYAIDSLLFDSVNQKLTEPDPLSTDWEGSKTQLGTGKIGAMVLGSWAISQMQAAAVKAGASADDIGYMAFPANVKGVQYATNAGDYAYGISKHSTAKAAAQAWITWFTEKSDYTKSQGMVSTLKDSPLPANLTGLSDAGVKLIEPAAAPKGKESLLSDVANQAQIDLYGQVYRQKLVDIARGAADGTKDGYFAELNSKWDAAVKQLVN
ncbi:ABC transporter substrate-binding protein [Microbacterium sp. 22303]|uniref:ABC transporter substrate-binding protein n=1 Tax=Microbacterium sp. 22303 TaxID=3453905 RepID=UPI003F864069